MISGAGTLSGLGGGNGTVTLASIDNDGSIVAERRRAADLRQRRGHGLALGRRRGTMKVQGAIAGSQTVAFGSVRRKQAAGCGRAGRRLAAKLVLHDARAFSGTIRASPPATCCRLPASMRPA